MSLSGQIPALGIRHETKTLSPALSHMPGAVPATLPVGFLATPPKFVIEAPCGHMCVMPSHHNNQRAGNEEKSEQDT